MTSTPAVVPSETMMLLSSQRVVRLLPKIAA
jgi:hypothetical protein